MKANNIRTVKMAMGSSKSMEGGGGNGGSIKGRMSKDAVRHISSSSDSNPCNDLLLPPCAADAEFIATKLGPQQSSCYAHNKSKTKTKTMKSVNIQTKATTEMKKPTPLR
ncbi:hypothetical protein V6N12_027167 [Hibiscus sabdariffa]|uniref:Uncharacterized protein n=1 Tax=Hibiscus sabdariffa TaxID=183260 RepID=A0ABR2DUF9_9ROSI